MGRPKMTEEEKAAARAAREAAAQFEDTTPSVRVATESLHEFIANREALRLHEGVVLVAASHPDGDERIYPGKYSGIRLSRGEPSVTYSDGTKQ